MFKTIFALEVVVSEILNQTPPTPNSIEFGAGGSLHSLSAFVNQEQRT